MYAAIVMLLDNVLYRPTLVKYDRQGTAIQFEHYSLK